MKKPVNQKWSRILSRKLVFLYYYARLFNEDIIANPLPEDDIRPAQAIDHEELNELTDWLGIEDGEFDVDEPIVASPIVAMDNSTMLTDIQFIADHQLPQHTNSQYSEYDHDFVMQLAAGYDLYRDMMAGLVAPYTDKFGYDEMSLTRRAIMLLGYGEHRIMHTPASIIINECVEMAKSYEDHAASKLINGIMHQLLEIKPEEDSLKLEVEEDPETSEEIDVSTEE